MTLVLVGDGDDARGFRLAGVDTRVCGSRGDVERAIADQTAGVLLVSDAVYRLAPASIEAARGRARGPIVAILPGTGPTV